MDLRIDGLVYRYPGAAADALAGIDLAIGAGERVALMGRNGSGKSTLIAHLVGLLRPSSGRVLLDGRDAATLRVAQLARLVGVAAQDPSTQLFHGRVRDEVAFGPRQLGLRGAALDAAVDAALDAAGLAGAADRNPYDVGPSGRRLLVTACVLAMGTPVVVLDEPTMGLPASASDRVGAIVERLAAEGRTVIVATHDVRFAAERCDRVVVFHEGRVRLDGPPAAVLAEPSRARLADAWLAPPPVATLAARHGLAGVASDGGFVAAWRAARRGPSAAPDVASAAASSGPGGGPHHEEGPSR